MIDPSGVNWNWCQIWTQLNFPLEGGNGIGIGAKGEKNWVVRKSYLIPLLFENLANVGSFKSQRSVCLAKDYSKLRDLSTRPTSVFFTNLFLWRLLADWPAVKPWEALYIYKAGLAAEEAISSLRCTLAMFKGWLCLEKLPKINLISFGQFNLGQFHHFTLCH